MSKTVIVRPHRGEPFTAELLDTRDWTLGVEGLVRYCSVIGVTEAWLPLAQIAPLAETGCGELRKRSVTTTAETVDASGRNRTDTPRGNGF